MNDTNPLLKVLNNKIPGEPFRLPSKGKFYEAGVLDPEVIDGNVIVYPMKTADDIFMKSPDMLYTGTAITTVFKRCIPQILQPTKLLSNDVTFLLACLRKVSYGSYITYKWQCSECIKEYRKANKIDEQTRDNELPVAAHDYNVPIEHFIRGTKELDNDDIEKFKIMLPSGQTVFCKPSTYDEILKMYQLPEKDHDIDINELDNVIADSILMVIQKVDDVTDREIIKEWIKELPKNFTEIIVAKISEVNQWGADFTYTIQCRDCQSPQEITTVIDPISFFMLPSSPVIENV